MKYQFFWSFTPKIYELLLNLNNWNSYYKLFGSH